MPDESPLSLAIQQIVEEKNIPYDSVIETIEAALAVAYRKDFGEKNQNIKVTFDVKTGGSRVFDVKTVVSDELVEAARLREEARLAEAAALASQPASQRGEQSGKAGVASDTATPAEPAAPAADAAAAETAEEPEEERFDPKTMIPLSEAKALKKGAGEGDEIRTELFPPESYGRMAAQTAKQVIIQKIREAERTTIFADFKDREGEIINGVIQRVEGRVVLVDVGRATGVMPPAEQITFEHPTPGQRVKVYIARVSMTNKGPEIIVSRSHPDMVRRLFAIEVPEIEAGSIEIMGIAREAGSRTKISVKSNDPKIDPVGSCVGQRGTRVQTVISELGGEKIDIIEYDEDSVKYIINALSPARILSVKLDEETRTAIAEVKEDQLSLAIGKAGQNVRLAAKLTGWRIDIVKEGETPEERRQRLSERAAKAAGGETPAADAKSSDTANTASAEQSTETPPPADAPPAETVAPPAA
ncbi:MAG: transcription termination/antitermination protein NusA [Candidatus Kerfeldbacteria bacterium]|nr:transcription termination/antitermination protein NusA [Candidatus Kerfeldbacteria bacterium]